MIAVALPGIVDDFGASFASATWLVTAYLVVMASVQPLAGKIGDGIGRRKLILGGLVLFLAVSTGAALAPSIWLLLAFRVGQALAISVVLSNSYAVLRQVVPASRRGRTFGIVEAATGLSAATGPLVGGLLITVADWRAIFFVNIPVVLLAIVLGWRSLPRDSRRGEWREFDYKGAVLLPASLVSIAVFFLLLARGGGPGQYVPVGIGAIALSALLLKLELAHSDPVIQPRLFKIRGFAAPSLGVGTSNLAMYSLLLVIPLLLTARRNYSPLEIGLILTSLTVGMALLSPIGGRMADRFGRRKPVVIGLSITAIATLLPAITGSSIGVVPLILGLGVIGLGLGLSTAGMRTSALESVASRDAGSVAGTYSTSRYFGSIVGSAMLAGLIGVNRSNTDGIDLVFIVVAAAAFTAVIAVLFMESRPEMRD
ncbi:MAG: MFS transporter [Chloroflexi bacterium]|nr:MFS transporter [Chloroflexota bacterium]